VILHTLPVIGIEASGPCYSVPRLCESLIELGLDIKLAVLDWLPGSPSPAYVERFALGWGPRRLGRSPAMARWLHHKVASGAVDVLHTHSLWMMPNVYPGRVRRAGSVRLVVSPHGTLTEWAMNHHRWRKKVMWHLGQSATLQRADAFHATAEAEYEDIRRLCFKQPVAVIPNYRAPTLRPRDWVSLGRPIGTGAGHWLWSRGSILGVYSDCSAVWRSVRSVRVNGFFVPLVFQAIYLGLRPDDWIVPAYFSRAIQILIIVVLLICLGRPLVIRTPKRT